MDNAGADGDVLQAKEIDGKSEVDPPAHKVLHDWRDLKGFSTN
jgi:hypothetical protein